MMSHALSGIRVLDLTRVLAGPFCTLQLADLGASVIKVEDPSGGDDSRAIGPFAHGISAYFASLNRNKRSLALNLKAEPGQRLLAQLSARADVLVENYRPGRMASWGLDYPRLAAINPRLVYASISGFGATGPDSHHPAYDIVVQARGGIMSITGPEDGQPTRVGASIADLAAGLYATSAILAALFAVFRTGTGQYIDIAMLDTQMAILENAIARYTVTGIAPRPLGNRHPSAAPFTSFATADGHIVVAIANDRLWERLCTAIDQPDLAADPRYLTNPDRVEHWPSLKSRLESVLRSRATASWLSVLEGAGIPCAPIQDIPAVLADPQVCAREMVGELPITDEDTLTVTKSPLFLSGCSRIPLARPPRLGEHSREILAELGLGGPELEQLIEDGVVGTDPGSGREP